MIVKGRPSLGSTRGRYHGNAEHLFSDCPRFAAEPARRLTLQRANDRRAILERQSNDIENRKGRRLLHRSFPRKTDDAPLQTAQDKSTLYVFIGGLRHRRGPGMSVLMARFYLPNPAARQIWLACLKSPRRSRETVIKPARDDCQLSTGTDMKSNAALWKNRSGEAPAHAGLALSSLRDHAPNSASVSQVNSPGMFCQKAIGHHGECQPPHETMSVMGVYPECRLADACAQTRGNLVPSAG
jgi:hypothetical protein